MEIFIFTSKTLGGHRIKAQITRGPEGEVAFADMDSPGGSVKYHMDALCEEFIMARQQARTEHND